MHAFDPFDLLLLRAALLDGQDALTAWQAVSPDLDIATAEHGRIRMLPLIHHNLLRLGVDDPRLNHMRGVRHYFWAKNQVQLRALAPLLRAFEEAGVGTLLLKGAALLAGIIEDSGLRPMDDTDLLVRRPQLGTAVQLLAAHGFSPAGGLPASSFMASRLDELTGYPFKHPKGGEIDLHWQALQLDRRPDADASLWRTAEPARLLGAPTGVPSPDALLLQVCSHAALWSETRGLRWVPDAMMILRGAGDRIDWDRLLREARERRLEAVLAPRLAALRHHFAADVPARVVSGLERRITRSARRHAALIARQPSTLTPHERRVLALEQFRRSRPYLMHRSLTRALPSFLRARYPADSRLAWLQILAFHALGRPSWLRRSLAIDRRLRRPPPQQLPATATGRPVFLDGWSWHEGKGRWTLGPEARLAWRLEGQQAGREIEITGWIVQTPDRRSPRIEIWSRGEHLATLANEPGKPARILNRRIHLPAALLAGQPALILTFAVYTPVVPRDCGLNDDTRPLGFFLMDADLLPPGTPR